MKRKQEEVDRATEKVSARYRKLLYVASGISASTSSELVPDMFRRSEDYFVLFQDIRSRLQNATSNQEKKQLLTLVPKSWTFEEFFSFFGEKHVSKRLIMDAFNLKDDKGILALPDKKSGRRLSDDEILCVQNFYLSDDYSRELPGMRTKVKTKERDADGNYIEKQKRLLLININELYAEFKDSFVRDGKKPVCGRSKFAQLRPLNVIPVGPKGTHNICVCIYHENTKLMLAPFNEEKNLRSWHSKIVCSINEPQCVFGECSVCPMK